MAVYRLPLHRKNTAYRQPQAAAALHGALSVYKLSVKTCRRGSRHAGSDSHTSDPPPEIQPRQLVDDTFFGSKQRLGGEEGVKVVKEAFRVTGVAPNGANLRREKAGDGRWVGDRIGIQAAGGRRQAAGGRRVGR